MIWIRSLIFSIGQWLFTIVFCTLGLLTFPLQPHTRYGILTNWAHAMLWWLRVCCGLSFKVTGAENIPQTPSIVLCKHQSAWETLALQLIFPPQVWVLKRELLWLPFFGWCLALTSPIAINRAAGREALKQLVTQGKDRLAQKFWVVIFPEGTRSPDGVLQEFKKGGFILALHSQHPIVPISLSGSHRILPKRGGWKIQPGRVQLTISAPIPTEGLSTRERDELIRRVRDAIREHLTAREGGLLPDSAVQNPPS